MDKKTSQTAYLTVEQFQEQIAPWSIDTIRRQIAEGMPAIRFSKKGPYHFDRKEVTDWFKRHTVRAG
jgi:hypothetical protein